MAQRKCNRTFFVFCLALLVVQIEGCAAPPDGPLLSYFAGDGEAFRWSFWDAQAGEERPFLTVREVPSLVFWDTQAGVVYFRDGNEIHSASYTLLEARASKAALMPEGPAEEFPVLWLDTETGRLRLIRMREFTAADSSGAVVPDEPPWGTPFLCQVLELQQDGSWLEIVRKGTKWQAGDTPGMSVVDEYRHERGFSQENLLASYTCASGMCGAAPQAVGNRTLAEIASQYGVSEPAYRSLVEGESAILFATVFGDTMHAASPVLLLRGTIPEIVPLSFDPAEQQLSIGVEGRYLLIAGEFTGDNPHVFDAASGEPLFSSSGTGATWVPGFAQRD